MCFVRKFGCGYTLRQGATTAATLNFIVGICTIISGAIYVKIADASVIYNQYEDTSILVATRTISGVVLANGLISLINCLFLVVGIAKKMTDFIKAWLIGSIIYIVLSLFFIFYGMIMTLYWMVGSIIFIMLYIYLWVVVFSYYRELKKYWDGLPAITSENQL